MWTEEFPMLFLKMQIQESIPVGCVPPACADCNAFKSHQISVMGWEGGGPQVNKFEQVSSGGLQMSLAGVPCLMAGGGAGAGQWGPMHHG